MEKAGVRPQGRTETSGLRSICLVHTLKFKSPESTVLDCAGLGGERQTLVSQMQLHSGLECVCARMFSVSDSL